jgi:putative phosphoribosyl transferase
MEPDIGRPPTPARYTDRRHAGKVLAQHLVKYASPHDSIVLALPRGGVPVGFEVASALRLPLDVFMVRKLGLPGHPELAMGAIASGGVTVFNDDIRRLFKPSAQQIEDVTSRERTELFRRERAYRGDRPTVPLAGRIAILVDDGLATGATMQAVVNAIRIHDPLRVVVAVPVGSHEACWRLLQVADDVVCPLTPERFAAVGAWYDDFGDTTDEEVRRLLGHLDPPMRRSA